MTRVSDHTHDAQCTLDADEQCVDCGVSHSGPPCRECGGRGFCLDHCNMLVLGAQINHELVPILAALELASAGGLADGAKWSDYDTAVTAARFAVANIKALADALRGET